MRGGDNIEMLPRMLDLEERNTLFSLVHTPTLSQQQQGESLAHRPLRQEDRQSLPSLSLNFKV